MSEHVEIAQAHTLLDHAEIPAGALPVRVSALIGRCEANWRLYAMTEKMQNEEMEYNKLLLDSLKRLVYCLENRMDIGPNTLEQARAAIATAEGA